MWLVVKSEDCGILKGRDVQDRPCRSIARFTANTSTKAKSYEITLTVRGKTATVHRWKVTQAGKTISTTTTTTTTTTVANLGPPPPTVGTMPWRPFLNLDNWILPEVSQVSGLTGLQWAEQGNSDWQAVAYTSQPDLAVSGTIDWVVPAIDNGINYEIRAISQTMINGQLVTTAVWNFPPSSGW